MRAKTRRRGCLIWAFVMIAFLATAPLLLPYPNQGKVDSAQDLVGPESRFVQVNGLRVHYQEAGEGDRTLILLHGLGAGVFGWEPVLGALGERYRVVAYDRPAFGLTERPMPGDWQGRSPYGPEAQVDLVIGLMDALGVERAVLVGHSAGGRIALETALRYPDRIEALVLADPAVYRGGGAPAFLRSALALPQMRRIGAWLMYGPRWQADVFLENAWHDPTRIDQATRVSYRNLWRLPDAERALWELVIATSPGDLSSRLGDVRLPVLVVTGDDDRIVPTAESVQVAQDVPDAGLVVVPDAGHVPQEECPEAFVRIVTAFLASLEH
ncbi:MAG: alpha/beta fold hydrolase [Anaerolineae bacterium]